MTSEEVRKLTPEELQIEVERLRGRLFTLRSQSVTEKVEDLSQFGKVKKDIARLLTEQAARRPKAEPAAKPVARPTVPAKIKPSSARKPASGATRARKPAAKPAPKAATK